MVFFVGFFIVAGVYFIYKLFTDPESELVTYIMTPMYRYMIKIRDMYINGIKRDPPSSSEFFVNRVEEYLCDEQRSKKLSPLELTEIISMMSVEDFVHYYFCECGPFTPKLFHEMMNEYRTGNYCKCSYSYRKKLKELLPIEISSNEKAFSAFIKLVDAGWFDKDTGKYILRDGRQKQHIGRAIVMICQKGGVLSPEKVFAPFWGESESTVKEWKRINKNNDSTTKAIDSEIAQLLN